MLNTGIDQNQISSLEWGWWTARKCSGWGSRSARV